MYANYLILVAVIGSLINQMFNALIPSLGSLLSTKNIDKSYRIFEQMNVFNFIVSGLGSLLIAICINDFILLWIGSGYVLSNTTVVLITISFFLSTMRMSSYIAKSAAGQFDIDKYTPMIQAAINLVCSLALVTPLGINGIILGTIISSVALPSWQRPYIAYRFIFKRSARIYFSNYLKYAILLVVSYLVLTVAGQGIGLISDNIIFTLVSKAIVTIVVFVSLLTLTSRNNPIFKGVVKLILATLGRLFKRQY